MTCSTDLHTVAHCKERTTVHLVVDKSIYLLTRVLSCLPVAFGEVSALTVKMGLDTHLYTMLY